jgi:hypothetical protein
MADDDLNVERPVHDGIFVTKGMLIGIPPGGLVVSVSRGKPALEVNTIHVRLNMCPRWLAIAYDHLLAAELAYGQVVEAYQAKDEELMGIALERESAAGMQAIFASCTAMDSYYALLREHTKIDSATLDSWRNNRTARYIRISEVIRRTFEVKKEGADTMRAILSQGFKLRDLAVHPSADMTVPMVYDEIRRATDKRLVIFRFQNAKMVTGQFLNVIAVTTLQQVRNPTDGLSDLLDSTNKLMAPTLRAWESRYGELFPRSKRSPGGLPSGGG